MKPSGLGPIQAGGTVVVVGGGPGGAAAAITLKQARPDLGGDLRVVMVEAKQFAGKLHYNQCSGVLSPPVMDLMEQDLGVAFPHHLEQCVIRGYVLHAARHQIVLDGEAEPSIALRRVQLDDYMEQAARQRGVEILTARVTDLEFHADRVIVYTDRAPLQADVVVGAFGLDEGTAAILKRAVGYHPPRSLSSVVTKFHPGLAGMAQFGERIHAFLPRDPRVEFGAITPKSNHLTINIAGVSVDADLMENFLMAPEIQRALPQQENGSSLNPNDLHYYKGRFPCGLARHFTGDRFVMVGDAAGLVRAFKGKGITSAMQTGIRAAHTILYEGISEGDFQNYRAANRDIIDDLPYGKAMRTLTILAARFGLMDAVLVAAGRDARLRKALFDAVSAHRPYREVMREAFSPASLVRVLAVAARRGS